MRVITLACVLAAAAQDPGAPASAPRLRVSLEAAPPLWIEGDPLRLQITVENLGSTAAALPDGWAAGEGIVLREVRSAPASSPPASAPLATVTPRPSDAARMALRVPAGGKLAFPVVLDGVEPPKGDAFEALFLSAKPPAGSEAARIERCENLRGALAHLVTDRGEIVIALAPESAPLATRNFARLVEARYYDGLAFHRVEKGSYVQAGDPDSRSGDAAKIVGNGGNTFNGRPLPLERSRAAFERGTVALARVIDPVYGSVRTSLAQFYGADSEEALDAKLRVEWPSALQLQETAAALRSATSQFFITVASHPHFLGRYAAFGKVVKGMEAVDAIEKGEVLGAAASDPNFADRPKAPVRIQTAWIERAGSAASRPR